MYWIIQNWILFWGLAVICSLFWGVYGCNHVWNYNKNGERKAEKDRKCFCRCFNENRVEAIGIFLSELIGSLAGWISLYLLIMRYRAYPQALGVFDAFLGIVAVLGITGFSSKIGKS
jgi:hypothetical protein